MYFFTEMQNLKQKDTQLLFGDLDLSKFQLTKKPSTNEYILHNQENGAIIDFVAYEIIQDYICLMHGVNRDEYKNYMSEIEFIEEYLQTDPITKQPKAYKPTLLPWMLESPAYMLLTFFAFKKLLQCRFILFT